MINVSYALTTRPRRRYIIIIIIIECLQLKVRPNVIDLDSACRHYHNFPQMYGAFDVRPIGPGYVFCESNFLVANKLTSYIILFVVVVLQVLCRTLSVVVTQPELSSSLVA